MSMYSLLMDQLTCMKGEVLELVHGERKYQEDEEKDLNSLLAGTGLETRKDPEHLTYYMDAVEQGHAGMWNVGRQYGLKESQGRPRSSHPTHTQG